jgi:hypothetical protein
VGVTSEFSVPDGGFIGKVVFVCQRCKALAAVDYVYDIFHRVESFMASLEKEELLEDSCVRKGSRCD